MYKIIGGDGREYGPVSADQIRQWVRENRANADTRACAEGTTEWRPLRDFPEFADLWVSVPPIAVSATVPTASRGPEQKVMGPAIGLLVTAGLGAVTNFFALIWYLMGQPLGELQAELGDEVVEKLVQFSSMLGVFGSLLGLAISAVVAYGAVQMLKLRSYGWSMAASILALIPCTSPCCLLGLPIGIWALVVLSQPEVKAALTRTA
ncbi:DUF4339 domain-containing protein [Limisphaera sp. VF-2]|jgi:hypothetical protein|uniref:DUF4339 domain-containing protein n=1 Tax=Limisphaera sp. VF-2 TaxID=3400418 RepID=UPI00256436DA|nr:DUF4339 domain-containing protein [Limisphaera sp.]